jgi:hypothetical protein
MSRVASGAFSVVFKDGREDQREFPMTISSCQKWGHFWEEMKRLAPHVSPHV